jgi:hypothetical protein
MLSLVEYPVITDSGIVKNTFAGFDDVEISFKREDIVIVSITQGTDNYIQIRVVGDISTELNLGEWIYCYSPATTLTYDFTAKVLSVGFSAGFTTILVEEPFIELSSGGYLNYKQNYFVEAQLVNPDNTDILIIPNSISDDGNASGEISINVNIPVDLLCQEFSLASGEIVGSRVKFKVKYRENYRDNTDLAFTLINDYSIILIYSTENAEAEKIANAFDEPIFWSGYPNALLLAHSDDNAGGERIDVKFSELDINKNVLVPEFIIETFNLNDYGMLQVSTSALDPSYEFNVNSQYGKLIFETTTVADYDSDDYDSDDYST